jgi:AcrB/AcrD/AcrF family
MKHFNLSEWAIRHRSLVAYFMIVIVIAGVWDYLRLGRSEDPDFTVKTMVVQAKWPGATVSDTLEQITDRIESKLQGNAFERRTAARPMMLQPRRSAILELMIVEHNELLLLFALTKRPTEWPSISSPPGV